MTKTICVPVEPTREQQLAMQKALLANYPQLIDGEVCTNGNLELAIYAAALAASTPVVGWEDISAAPKDRTPVLAIVHGDLFPRVCPGRPDLERWNGQRVVVHHPGLCEDGFDMGWSVSAPVGVGIGKDDWFAGWMPLPPPPSVSTDNGSRPQEAVPTVGLSPLVVALCESLRDNDNPNEPIADNGASVIDGWRDLARRILSTPQPADSCSSNEGAGK